MDIDNTIKKIINYDLLALSLVLFDSHDENYLSDVMDWFYVQYAREHPCPVPLREISGQLRESLEILLFIK